MSAPLPQSGRLSLNPQQVAAIAANAAATVQKQQQQQRQQQQQAAAIPQFSDYRLKSGGTSATHQHVMRIMSRTPVEVRDLVPPVRMYRRDPRSATWEAIRQKTEREAAAAAAAAAAAEAENPGEASSQVSVGADAALDAKGARQRKKKMRPGDSIDTSVIAPFGGAALNRRNLFKKRTRQVFLSKDSAEVREERRRDNYPWILEDFDASHSFTGNLSGGQGHTAKYALFFFSDDGFRVVMADKWYKFQPKPKYRTLTAEEAEEQMQLMKKKESDRWIMHRFGRKEEDGEDGESEAKPAAGALGVRSRRDAGPRKRGMRTVDRGESSLFTDDEDDGNSSRKRKSAARGDVDELDFDIDQDFQDDEEGMQDPEQQDEETKESTRRQKSNYRMADQSDIEEVDDMEDSDKEAGKEKLSSAGKEMRKIVRGIEHDAVYESDNEKDPYAESGEEDVSASETDAEKAKDGAGTDTGSQAGKRKNVSSPGNAAARRAKSAAGANKTMKRRADSLDDSASESDSGRPISPSSPTKRMRMQSAPHSAAASGNAAKALLTRHKPNATSAPAGPSSSPSLSRPAATTITAHTPATPNGEITEQEVVALIGQGGYDIKRLVAAFRSRIQGRSARANRLKSIILAVAQTKDGKLVLRRR
ncbi:hypothetical protein THASP1DRAFT_24626 [Thamnocephalis sphaerospora]|uniref:Transcription initiation factor IIF subunit alpha n=1 Tax=Thamnocephalis sphaerospora TaxID=78915 RepID=A0A4V1IWD5_9FUNG|nr:hypothetical protein THASP1DRAFT_24626 [Thamnocephalis sphaerospora]|eukprot:RKP07179.1 hypothetical protein THASP1DRAFT_24626 [Thamnocephalis sphaerospora]